jgi:hypothetical protein
MLVSDLKDRLHELFLSSCEVDEFTGCWVWTGAWDKSGNGVVSVQGRLYSAHRVAAWVYRGGFRLEDASIRVYHTCQTPACFAPEHLAKARGSAGVNQALARLGRFRRRSKD